MAEGRHDKSPSFGRSREDIALSDIPENEIVEDFPRMTTGQEMIIYTMDEQGLMFPLSPSATASELMPDVIAELGLSHEADEIFALWLMSPLLEIQLKPHHSPFRISAQWEDLLIKFTNCNEEEISKDEPVLMFRRHAMLSRSREKYVEDPRIVELLFYEAERNITNGRWPLELADYHQLAGLSACVRFGNHDPSFNSQKFYKDHLEEIYPRFLLVKKRPNRQMMTELFTVKHREAGQRYGGATQEEKWEIEKIYLKHCWELPYYGSSIFHGQVETPTVGTLSRLSNYQDTPVYVAINREGVFVLDKTKVTLLLGLLYNEFCWEYAEPSDTMNRNCLPCLFLHFHEHGSSSSEKTKLLQVFSRQAVMMDALIKACKASLADNMTSSGACAEMLDSVDGQSGSIKDLEAFSAKLKSGDNSSCMANKMKRLCLATFNAQGTIRNPRARSASQERLKGSP